jgi:hypothetical protein
LNKHDDPCWLGRDQSWYVLPSRVFANVLLRLKETFRMLVLAALFANALVDFDFELLPLAMMQRRLD